MRFSPVLFLHICGAIAGLLSGAVAISFRKGSRRHGLAGNVFVLSMLTMCTSAAYLAFVKSQTVNFLVGVLTLYLVATAWWVARHKAGKTGIFDWAALLAALAVGADFVTHGLQAARSQTGLNDGYPAAPFFIFGSIALLSAAGDVRMLARGGVSGAHRVVRHLWRMTFAFFIVVMSLFVGKQNLFPASVRGSKLLSAPPLLVLMLIIFWLVRVRFSHAYKRTPQPIKPIKVARRFVNEQVPIPR